MPTREAIVNTVLPQQVERPIPVRTVSTRSQPQPRDLTQRGNSEAAPAASAPEESVKLSPQLTALARKEQAYRKRESEFKEREKTFGEKLGLADRYSQLEQKLKAKDFSMLEELGLNYDGYTEYLLNKQAEEDPETAKFKQLEQEIQSLKADREESATKEYEETVAAYDTEISKLVTDDPRFSKTKKAAKQDAVRQLILDTFDEDKVLMSVEDAALAVEQHLTEEAKKWASLIEEPAQVEEKLPPPKLSSRTLTNNMGPTGTERKPQKSLQHLSENERYEEARRRVLERRQQQGR